MSTKKDEDEFVGYAAHVSQMKDFVLPVPPPEERPQTVWDMYAAEEASKSRKTPAKQSPSGAAHAEQEK